MADTDFEFGYNETDTEQTTEPDTSNDDNRCMAPIYCPACRRRHGLCSEVEAQLKGENMLPQADGNSSSGNSSSRRRSGGLRYLKIEDLSKTPREAKILAVKAQEDGRFGAAVVIKLALEGNTMFWTVNVKRNPNYRLLVDKFGQEENDWAGQKILLNLEADEFSDQLFPRVGFPTEAGKSAGRSGR